MGMKHEIVHGLSPELAKTVIDKAMESYAARFSDYSPTFRWTGDMTGELGFSAKGVTVKGSIEIQGEKILVDLEVPWILRVFKGKALQAIDSEVKGWVQKARDGAL